jgi:hypothetical protein
MFFNGRLAPAHQYARSGQTSEAPDSAAALPHDIQTSARLGLSRERQKWP